MLRSRMIAVAACCLALAGQGPGLARAELPPTRQPAAAAPVIAATRQNAFTIPFRIEPVRSPSEKPVEVQLHLSIDRGATWKLVGRVKPDKGAFVFRAPRDGEYWYSIRTVDGQGVVRPEGDLQSQLQVTVDTVAPRLDLSAERGAAGEIIARWQAVDPHLKPASFKLEYQTNPADAWEPIAVEPALSEKRRTLTGEATWWPKLGSDSLSVRATITDTAGNPAVNQVAIRLGGAPGSFPTGEPQSPANPNLAGSANTTTWPASRADNPLGVRAPGNSSNPRAPADDNWRPTSPATAPGGSPRFVAQPVAQSTRSRVGGSNLDPSFLPPGTRPRMVKSRAFELEYEVESVGSSGIGKVELWGTRDGGRTWALYGDDPDNISPLPVKVDAEGIYGFRIVVQSGSGLGGRPPISGDAPEVWIGVDLSEPVVRITGTEIVPEAGELVIRWEAADDLPDSRPISLLFATTPAGAWTPIAAGLENTGGYRWRLDNRVPDRVYLRLQMRDEAGNVGTFDTPEPVSLDRTRPQGHIRGVRPVGQASRGSSVR